MNFTLKQKIKNYLYSFIKRVLKDEIANPNSELHQIMNVHSEQINDVNKKIDEIKELINIQAQQIKSINYKLSDIRNFMNISNIDNPIKDFEDNDFSFNIKNMKTSEYVNGISCGLTILNHGEANIFFETENNVYASNKFNILDFDTLKDWKKYIFNKNDFTSFNKFFFCKNFSNYKLILPEKYFYKKTGKNVLIITHEFSLSGAPLVLLEAVKLLVENGEWPLVLGIKEGPLIQNYIDMGVPVIIDDSLLTDTWRFKKFAEKFDLVFVNTIVCFLAISKLSDTSVPVIWWLHEGFYTFELYKNVLPKKTSNNIHIYPVSDYVKKIAVNYGLKIINDPFFYCLNDYIVKEELSLFNKKKINFCIVGSIEFRKGQDIFIEAIKRIKSELLDKINIYLIGKLDDKDFFNKYGIQHFPSICYLGVLKHEETLKVCNNSDVIIVPSRDDPLPVVASEAFMLDKLCIVSDSTGTASIIKDNENGIIFKNEDVDELTDIIINIIEHPEILNKFKGKSREIYEKYFTIESFKKRFSKIYQDLMKP